MAWNEEGGSPKENLGVVNRQGRTQRGCIGKTSIYTLCYPDSHNAIVGKYIMTNLHWKDTAYFRNSSQHIVGVKWKIAPTKSCWNIKLRTLVLY